MRMRVAFSTTRAPILSRRSLEGGELGAGERRGAGDGVAQGEHEPIGCGVQDKPELVGERALAGDSVRGELAIVHLDRVFGLTMGTGDVFVEMAGLASERGDDIADQGDAPASKHYYEVQK